MCGYNRGTITNCYNTGTVSGNSRVGGVCGNNYRTITYFYNTGAVNGTQNVGGVCGYNLGTITNCYNTGTVSGNSRVGGVCGNNYRTITNCYYLDSEETDSIDGTTFKTTVQFASGEVAYLLNGSTSEGTLAWGQEIGTDDVPVLGGAKVYQVNAYEGCEAQPGNASTGYSNTNAPVYAKHNMTEHPENSATCTEDGNHAYWTCSYEKGVYYKNAEGTEKFASLSATVIPALKHNDTDNDGYCDNGCGQPIHSILTGVSATLAGDIGLNYYIALPKSVTADEGAYVQFTVNGQNTTVFVRNVTAEENGTYKFTCWLAAKEMRDNVTFKLYDGNGTLIDIYKNSGDIIEGASFDYSLETYLNKLSSDENAALKNLADATLLYGAYAQIAFNHNPDLSFDGSELADVTVDTLESNRITKSADIPEGLNLTEMTLILETETTLRLYFKSDNIGNYTFKLDGIGVTLNKIEEEGLYYVEIANISAKDLDTTHTLIVNDTCTLKFNALSYAYSTVKAGADNNICNVVKALYKYNDAANAYFGE